MGLPRLTADQVAYVSTLVSNYITTQRSRYASAATSLSIQQKAALTGFFSESLLENTSALVLVGERVANPDFYPMLRTWGFTNLPDQSAMSAITFSDTVVSHVHFTDNLLFHELVHVEQYRQMGIGRFAELYVRGFLNGGSYEAIPLERNAYELGERYMGNRFRPFRVTDEVARWIAEDRF